MKKVLIIARRDLLSYAVSPVTYMLFAALLLFGGYFFFNLLLAFQNDLQRYQSAPARVVQHAPNLNEFVISPFFQVLCLLLLFIVPLLTMRTFAEEKKSGTLEYLLTAPVSEEQVVFGKFLAVFGLVVAFVTVLSIFPALLCFFGNPEVLLLFSGWIGVVLFAFSLTGIGVMTSVCTSSQMLAALSGLFINLFFYVLHSSVDHVGPALGTVVNYLSPRLHLKEIFHGVVAVSAVSFFLSLAIAGISSSIFLLKAQRMS